MCAFSVDIFVAPACAVNVCVVLEVILEGNGFVALGGTGDYVIDLAVNLFNGKAGVFHCVYLVLSVKHKAVPSVTYVVSDAVSCHKLVSVGDFACLCSEYGDRSHAHSNL